MSYSRRMRWGDGRSGLPRVEFAADLEARVVGRRTRERPADGAEAQRRQEPADAPPPRPRSLPPL